MYTGKVSSKMKGLSLFILITSILGVVPAGEEKRGARKARRLGDNPNHSNHIGDSRYPFCKSGNITGACMEEYVCAGEAGRFMGYCGYADGVCCDVTRTCGGATSAHSFRFQNPSFPRNDTEAKVCNLRINVGKGICALRMDNYVFELGKYSKDFCPVDSLTILGTKKTVALLCGNMTGWQTTFEVKAPTVITFAMAVQGIPAYRFSTLITMIACSDVISMESPLNAGLINTDAPIYVPTTTTTEAPETTTMEDTDSTTVESETETETEQPHVETTTYASSTTSPSSKSNTTNVMPVRRNENDKPTPLPVGKIKIRPRPAEVDARYKDVEADYTRRNENEKPTPLPLRKVDARYEDDKIDYISEYYDNTPNSLFKKIFDAKTKYKCRTYDDPEDTFTFERHATPSEKVVVRSSGETPAEKCWLYDAVTGEYKVNEECALEEGIDVHEEEEGGFRIIGGKLTNINEYPWQVALIYKKRFFCGGALISDRYVITASHCVFGSFYSGIHNLKVSLGDHDLSTKNETKNLLADVRRVIWHLHYSSTTTQNDIGLLELMEPVEFSYNILPAILPTDINYNYEGQNATVTGWGRNNLRNRKTSPVLKEYTAPIDNIDKCVKKWGAYTGITAIKGMHLCLNVTYGTPCHGDSGGPLVACNNGRRCTLIGVVSFGFPLCRNVGLSAVFTKVTTYKRWVDINTTPLFYHNL